MRISAQAFPKKDMSRMEQFWKKANDVALAKKITDDIAKYFGDIKEAFEICEVCFTCYYLAAIAVLTLSKPTEKGLVPH